MSTVPVVEARQVVKRYGATVALDHADLTVLPGQTHALVGRNGAGKSTLVSVLTGLTEPDSGSVLVNGEPAPGLSDRDEWRSPGGRGDQRPTIIPRLSGGGDLFLNRQENPGRGRRPGAGAPGRPPPGPHGAGGRDGGRP